MLSRLRARFWIQTVLATLNAVLFVCTAIWPQWIELVFAVDPDDGSGALEAGVVVLLLLLTLICGALARAEWRRHGIAVS
jgi:hypothetical protein